MLTSKLFCMFSCNSLLLVEGEFKILVSTVENIIKARCDASAAKSRANMPLDSQSQELSTGSKISIAGCKLA